MGTPTSDWFLRTSTAEQYDEETEHNGITKSKGTHELVAYLLGVGPKPEIIDPSSSQRFSKATEKTVSSISGANAVSEAPIFHRYTSSQFPAPHDLSNYSPARYLTITGRTDVAVRDEFGNTAAIENGLLRNGVPGLKSYEVIGENSIMLMLSISHSYTIDFKASETPMEIEMVEGYGNRQPNSALRYKDINLPANANVRMTIPQSETVALKYDANSDGEVETVIAPTVNVSGITASDTTAPTVNINAAQVASIATVTIAAQDLGSGVKKIYYSLDGQNFSVYTAPFVINYTLNPVTIKAFADDNVANRSTPVKKIFTVPER